MKNVLEQKILLVENDYSLNSLICIRLKEAGLICKCIFSGYEAKEFLKNNTDYFAILDYGLEDLDCERLIRELKADNIDFPFVIITGYDSQEIVVKMMKLGAYDFIHKDVGFIEHLPEKIFNAIEKYKSKQDASNFYVEKVKSEEHLKNIFDNIQDIYMVLSKRYVIEKISPSVFEVLGFEVEQLIGKNVSDMYFHSYEWKRHYLQMSKTGILKNGEALLKTGNNLTPKICLINSKKVFINTEKEYKIIATVKDIAEYKKLGNEIITKTIHVEEKERKRIAENLHDDLGPLLSTVKIYLNLLKSSDKKEEEKQEIITTTSEIIDEAIRNIRQVVNELMPTTLNDYGLEKAFQSFFYKLKYNINTKINFSCNLSQDRLGAVLESTIYRSGIELINNGLKHSFAKEIVLILEQIEDNIWLKYSDNGVGFDYDEQQIPGKTHGHGLSNLSNRIKSLHGKINIKSIPSKGTTVQILFVLSNIYDV